MKMGDLLTWWADAVPWRWLGDLELRQAVAATEEPEAWAVHAPAGMCSWRTGSAVTVMWGAK